MSNVRLIIYLHHFSTVYTSNSLYMRHESCEHYAMMIKIDTNIRKPSITFYMHTTIYHYNENHKNDLLRFIANRCDVVMYEYEPHMHDFSLFKIVLQINFSSFLKYTASINVLNVLCIGLRSCDDTICVCIFICMYNCKQPI